MNYTFGSFSRLVRLFRWELPIITFLLLLVPVQTSAADSSQHPAVMLSADELKQLRLDLAVDPYRREIYQSLIKANADDWVTRTVTIPPRGGYYHDFACTDGARLIWPRDLRHAEPIPAGQHYQCSACGAAHSGPKLDGAVRYLQHVQLMLTTRNLAFTGTVEQDDRYTSKATDILAAYADAYPGGHTSAVQGGILYQSLDEAVHFIYLAQAYDLIAAADIGTTAILAHIRERLLWPCAEGLIKCGIGGNWGSWHLSAVGVIGFATGHTGFQDYGIMNFKEQIAEQLGDDGLWPESVHTYHFYPMRGFLHLAEAARAAGHDLYRWQARPGKSLIAMFTRPLQYAYPNLQLPAINDGWYSSWLPLGVYEVGYNRLRIPELEWAVDKLRKRTRNRATDNPDGSELWTVIHGIPVTRDIAEPDFASTNFHTIGICTLRQRQLDGSETMLTFDYGRHLGHGQADKMGITLYARGRLLMQDFGTPSYGSGILPYYKGTSSHNTIMIDGKNQQHTGSHGLLAFLNEPELKAAVAETTEVATGVTWSRLVALTPEYALVADYLDSQTPHQYDSLLHAVGDKVSLAPAPNSTSISAGTLGLKWFDHVESYPDPASSGTARWSNKADATLQVPFAVHPAAHVFTAKIPGLTGGHPVPALVQRVTAATATFANILHISKAQHPPQLELNGSDIVVRGTAFEDRFTSDSAGLRWHRSRAGQRPSNPITIHSNSVEQQD